LYDGTDLLVWRRQRTRSKLFGEQGMEEVD
jgi:hypothetical protein